jgi:ABC-type transport system involved in multi-copper enzyme maturation permease subunit
MLTLIGREVHDHLVYLMSLCLVTVITIAVLIAGAYEGVQVAILLPLAIPILSLLLGLCALGAGQMYGDRANRISPLLSTLAVTRTRILLARVLVGVLAALLTLVPVIVTSAIVLWISGSPLEFYGRTIVEVSLTVVLTGIACYCAGLLVGWTTNKSWLLVGNTLVMFLVLSLVWIKGFGPDAMALWLLLIGAVLLRVWHAFTSASL